MEERYAGSKEATRVSEQRHAEGRQETDSLGLGGRHQADFADGDEAAGAARDQVRIETQTQERDARAQREYSEIYGRRIPRLGLRPGTRRVPRAHRDGARELDSG